MEEYFCIATLGGKESLAEARLSAAGFDVYLPKTNGTKKSFGHEYPCRVPLFPSYLFAYSEPDDLLVQLSIWHQMRLATGIQKVLTSRKNDPIPIDFDFIYELQMNELENLKNLPEQAVIKKENPFKLNDKVIAKAGSIWTGQAGRIISLSKVDRVRVLFAIMYADRKMEKEVDIDTILLLKETSCLHCPIVN